MLYARRSVLGGKSAGGVLLLFATAEIAQATHHFLHLFLGHIHDAAHADGGHSGDCHGQKGVRTFLLGLLEKHGIFPFPSGISFIVFPIGGELYTGKYH